MNTPQLYFPCRTWCKITTPFGVKGDAWGSGMHNGTDIDDEMGAPVYAAYGGIVVHVGEASPDRPKNKAWGRYICLIHSWKDCMFRTYYAHLSGECVNPGMEVDMGREIGKMGNSGNVRPSGPASDGSHLCFGLFVLRDGKWQWEAPRFFNDTVQAV